MLIRALFNNQTQEISADAAGDPVVWQNACVNAISVVNNLTGDLRIEGSAGDIAALVSAGVIVDGVFQFLRVVAV